MNIYFVWVLLWFPIYSWHLKIVNFCSKILSVLSFSVVFYFDRYSRSSVRFSQSFRLQIRYLFSGKSFFVWCHLNKLWKLWTIYLKLKLHMRGNSTGSLSTQPGPCFLVLLHEFWDHMKFILVNYFQNGNQREDSTCVRILHKDLWNKKSLKIQRSIILTYLYWQSLLEKMFQF